MRYTILEKVVPAPRPRVTKSGHTYNARKYTECKTKIRKALLATQPEISTMPLEVKLTITLSRPKAHYNSKGLKINAPKYHTSRFDVDNLAKTVLDAANGVLWKDDGQIVYLQVTKKYGATDLLEIEVCVPGH